MAFARDVVGMMARKREEEQLGDHVLDESMPIDGKSKTSIRLCWRDRQAISVAREA